MSVEKNTQQQNSTQDKPAKKTTIVDNKSSIGVFAKINLVVSIAALGLSSYVLVNAISQAKNSNTNFQVYTAFDKQLKAIKSNQDQQKNIANDLSAQNDALTQSVKALQSQLITINNQIATPAKDLYMQMSVINIQSAINYLILAKDVMIFDGDSQKASELVDDAFDKIQASRVATVSVSERQNIKSALTQYSSRDEIIKEFIAIEQQFAKLEYLTPEDISTTVKSQDSKNKYMKLLSSIVEIQDIPKNQTLVATKYAKEFVADSLYRSLISLQSAMYINNQEAIDKAKNNLVAIVKKYFVQNEDTKKLINAIQGIKAQNLDSFNTSIDKLISQLSKQQNQLLAQQPNLNKTNISAEGSQK
ncbi:hypothetical protein [Francisella hispaniensis]|uniref:Uncharacterized protein n=1 Tax=Francisella hispaniensis FSC454 TaxID=1088883 RepID=A0AAC9J5N5_9GAMM|nr:hypothetical protein [Francisella hispaniensis]APD50881.1 hypothetical protein FSC454_07085 [Francisella hispaniensis FSC454]KYW82568.1 hypothetical protein AUF42_08425 [Francisella hispaniensis FSC454]